jgi:hypothetical protein
MGRKLVGRSNVGLIKMKIMSCQVSSEKQMKPSCKYLEG